MRAIGIPDDVYSAGLGILATGQFPAIATGNINAGELCMLSENGRISRVDPNLPWSAINQSQRNLTTTVAAISEAAVAVIKTDVNANAVETIIMTEQTILNGVGITEILINESYVIPCQTSTGVGFTIFNSGGSQLTNFILAVSDTSAVAPHALALVGGYFVLVWHVSATLKFMIFDPSGNAITSATTVTSACATSGLLHWHTRCAFSNGNFLLAWSTTGGALQFAIYNVRGVLTVGPTTLDVSCFGVSHVAAHCANDDIVIGCYDTGTTRYKLHRITNAGVHSWGPIYPTAAYAGTFTFPDNPHMHPDRNRLFEMPPGPWPVQPAIPAPGSTAPAVNEYPSGYYSAPIVAPPPGPGAAPAYPYLCWLLPHSDGYAKPFIFGWDGAFIQFCDPGPKYRDPNIAHPICYMPSGFGMIHHLASEPNTYASFYDYLGNPLLQNVLLDEGAHQFPAGVNPNLACYFDWAGSGLHIIRYAYASGSCEVYGITCDGNGNQLGPPVVYKTFGAVDVSTPFPVCGPAGSVFPCWFDSGNLAMTIALQTVTSTLSPGQGVTIAAAELVTETECTIQLCCSSVIGVAAAAAADGGPVTIVSEGYFTLPASQNFRTSSSFDQRKAPVLGVRGSVGGNRAMLFGWE